MVWCRMKSENEYECINRDKSPGLDWFPIEAAPRFGERLETIDGVVHVVPFAVGEQQKPDPRALLAAALPDILLAVANGADLREELQRVLKEMKDA